MRLESFTGRARCLLALLGISLAVVVPCAAQCVQAPGFGTENLPSIEHQVEAPRESPEEPNFGLTLPQTVCKVTGIGPFSGEWNLGGAVDGFASMANNVTPNSSGMPRQNPTLSLLEGVVTIQKKSGQLQMTFWGGAWQTPAQGINSDLGPFNSLARFGSPANPMPSDPAFKWWLTWHPSKHFEISAGKMHSLMGTEIGFDYFNPTPLVSELNNMQATPGYGPEVRFAEGPLHLNVQYSDAYHTGQLRYLSANLLYQVNEDDFLLAFGGESTGRTGIPGPGFARQNSSLAGVGAQFIFGRWLISPEAEYQWLPKDSVGPGSGLPRPLTTYYNLAAMTDVVDQVSADWSVAGQVQYVFQNTDKHDPNAATFGNWLQSGFPPNPGVFSPGTSLSGAQIVPTWQHQRVFARADFSFVHLANYAGGTGYGFHGNRANQFVALLEIGFLI